MPIDYSEYHPKWSLISKLIRFRRAKNKCEWCGVVNYHYVNKKTRQPCLSDEDDATRIVLTVAHLDHDKTNNRFSNLAALCQKCHLGHDRSNHILNRKFGRNWKQNQIPINYEN